MTQHVLEQKVIKNPEESKSDAILSETKNVHTSKTKTEMQIELMW